MGSLFFTDEIQIKQLAIPDLRLSLIISSVLVKSKVLLAYLFNTFEMMLESRSSTSPSEDSSSLRSVAMF